MSYIQVPLDQAGKKVAARTVQDGADTVYRQTVELGDVTVTASGEVPIRGAIDVVSGPVGANALQVQGAGPHAATAIGHPIRIAGNYAGQTRDLQCDVTGVLGVNVVGPTGQSAQQVQGVVQAGDVFSGYPQQIAGTDNGGIVRRIAVDSAGLLNVNLVSSVPTGANLIGQVVTTGNIAHDGLEDTTRYPVLTGATAQPWGASALAVDAGDRVSLMATRVGQLLVLGGHSNVLSTEYVAVSAGNGFSLVGDIPAGSRCIVTMLTVRITSDTPANVTCRIGFGTASVPPAAADHGISGNMVFSGYTAKAGDVAVLGNGGGIIGIGGPDEELRCDNSSGTIVVNTTYFVVEA